MIVLCFSVSFHFSAPPLCTDSPHIWLLWFFSKTEYCKSLRGGVRREEGGGYVEGGGKYYKRKKKKRERERKRGQGKKIISGGKRGVKQHISRKRERERYLEKQWPQTKVCVFIHQQVTVWRCSRSARRPQVSTTSAAAPPLLLLSYLLVFPSLVIDLWGKEILDRARQAEVQTPEFCKASLKGFSVSDLILQICPGRKKTSPWLVQELVLFVLNLLAGERACTWGGCMWTTWR